MDFSGDHRKMPKLSSSGGGGRDLINNLPDECIANIFTFLQSSHDRCACAAVSRKWLLLLANIRASGVVVESNAQATKIPFSRQLMGKKANDIRLAALAVRAYPLRALTFLCIMGLPSSSVTDHGLEIIAKASPWLKSLNLWDCDSIGDAGFNAVAKWCGDLERLHLINLPMVTDVGLSSIANNCAKLSVLSIESCPSIGSESFEAIAKKSLKLRALSIIKCPLVQGSAIASVLSNSIELTTLKISMMRIGDEVLRAASGRARQLQVLHLEKVKGPTETGYSCIGSMEELKSLKLRLCVGLTGASLADTSFTKLKEIVVQRCGYIRDEVLINLSKSAKSLKSFRLEECGGFTYRGLKEALQNWRQTLKLLSLTKCSIIAVPIAKPGENALLVSEYPSLHTLELKQCDGVGDNLLCLLGLACNQVREVCLASTNTFTDLGLARLLIYMHPGNLASLDLTGCTAISNTDLCFVVEELGAGLKSLKLGGCSGVNDGVVATVATHCVVLEELNVDGCEISDLSLWWLVGTGKDRLQSLSLAGCAGVTDAGLKCLERMTWDNLKMLDIRNCPRISKQGVCSFQELIWWCNMIW